MGNLQTSQIKNKVYFRCDLTHLSPESTVTFEYIRYAACSINISKKENLIEFELEENAIIENTELKSLVLDGGKDYEISFSGNFDLQSLKLPINFIRVHLNHNGKAGCYLYDEVAYKFMDFNLTPFQKAALYETHHYLVIKPGCYEIWGCYKNGKEIFWSGDDRYKFDEFTREHSEILSQRIIKELKLENQQLKQKLLLFEEKLAKSSIKSVHFETNKPSEDSEEKCLNTPEELSPEDRVLFERFQELDSDGDGFISKEELKVYYEQDLGQKLDETQLKVILHMYDENWDGKITWDEFKRSYDSDNRSEIDDLRAKFRMYDLDGDGYIKKSEIQQVMRAINGEDYCENDVEEMMQTVDTDGDGQISIEEFTKRYQKDQDSFNF